MNQKLKALTDVLIRDVQARFPDFVLEVEPRGRKSAYIYMIAPDVRIWDDADVWDTVDEIAWKQLGRVIKDGYSIMLLPHQPLSAPTRSAPAMLREKPAEWHEEPEGEPPPDPGEA
ncbi:MAG: hypothetical protein NT169_01355 [Chloroflexi bacterium]|nr:hypothetical protein [Chloroflexota bacterium]